MRGVVLFVAGTLVGVGTQRAAESREIVGLNHVAIRVPNLADAEHFYADVLGFPEAFHFPAPDGQPGGMAYVQINRNAFVELAQATPGHPAGFFHFGLEVRSVDSVVKRLRARGVQVTDPTVSPRTKTRLAMATTPQGTQIELLEFGPESLHRKVMDAWKP